jgi:hypothetical protein
MQTHILPDRQGAKVGEIEVVGPEQVLRDRQGRRLGSYDARTDLTRDRQGSIVGRGNLLTRMLK